MAKVSSQIQQRDQELFKVLGSKGKNAWSSKGRIKDIHTLFRYPAVMVPDMLEDLLEILLDSNPDIEHIFDPFMGSGTSLVSSMKFGKNCYGQDINPLAVLVAKVKTGPFFTNALEDKIPQLYNRIEGDSHNSIEIDYDRYNYWFTEEVAKNLSRISRAIRGEKNRHIRRFFWVSLAETVRLTSNDRTSTYKLHRRSEEELKSRKVNSIKKFKSIVDDNATDLRNFKKVLAGKNLLSHAHYSNRLKIWLEDSKEKVKSRKKNEYYDLLVTSPPYGDNKTTVPYGQHSHLPLLWIDLKDIDQKVDESYLRTQSEIDKLSIGGTRKGKLNDLKISLVQKSDTLQEIFSKLEPKANELTKKVAYFYNDLFKSIENAVGTLKPNGYMVWVVGNRRVGDVEIHTDKILSEFLRGIGANSIKDLNREINHKRMPSRNNISDTMNQEKILIFRKTS